MAKPPLTKALKPDVLEGADRDEKLLDGLNRFMGPTASALAGNLVLGENVRCQVHTSGAIAVPDDWVDLELATGWSHVTGLAAPKIRKAPDGRVYLRGAVKASALGIITMLDAGRYAPAGKAALATVASGAFAAVDVNTTGVIEARVGTTTSNFLLEGLSWDAANRDPEPAACWPYEFDYTLGTSRPRVVQTVEVREVDNNRPVLAPNPDWDFAVVGGKPKIRVRGMPGLTPERTYRITWVVYP